MESRCCRGHHCIEISCAIDWDLGTPSVDEDSTLKCDMTISMFEQMLKRSLTWYLTVLSVICGGKMAGTGSFAQSVSLMAMAP